MVERMQETLKYTIKINHVPSKMFMNFYVANCFAGVFPIQYIRNCLKALPHWKQMPRNLFTIAFLLLEYVCESFEGKNPDLSPLPSMIEACLTSEHNPRHFLAGTLIQYAECLIYQHQYDRAISAMKSNIQPNLGGMSPYNIGSKVKLAQAWFRKIIYTVDKYVYVCICICLCMYTCTCCVFAHSLMCVHTYVHIHTHIHTFMHNAYTYIHTYIHIYVHTYIHIYVHTYRSSDKAKSDSKSGVSEEDSIRPMVSPSLKAYQEAITDKHCSVGMSLLLEIDHLHATLKIKEAVEMKLYSYEKSINIIEAEDAHVSTARAKLIKVVAKCKGVAAHFQVRVDDLLKRSS